MKGNSYPGCSFALSIIRSDSAGILNFLETLSLMYSKALTPNFLAVWTIVRKASFAVVPASDIVCRLTSCLRFSTLAPNSESLLCSGNPGYFKTNKSSSFCSWFFLYDRLERHKSFWWRIARRIRWITLPLFQDLDSVCISEDHHRNPRNIS